MAPSMPTPRSLRARSGLRRLPLLAAVAASAGCFADAPIFDLDLRVVIPKEAATAEVAVRRDTIDPTTGNVVDSQVTLQTFENDLRMLGPVYIGLYADVVTDLEAYPTPIRGAAFQSVVGEEGESYPYGGTSIGDFRFACARALACRVVSGRYETYDDIVDFFTKDLGNEIFDAYGEPITTGARLKSACYEILNATSDDEVRLTAYRDNNDDGEIDKKDLDFTKDANGDWVTTVRLWQQEFFPGFKPWAFLDTPASSGNSGRQTAFGFTTCNPEAGFRSSQYAATFNAGVSYNDILNRPYRRIAADDWVSSAEISWEDPYVVPELVLDFKVPASIALPDPTDTGDTGGGAP